MKRILPAMLAAMFSLAAYAQQADNLPKAVPAAAATDSLLAVHDLSGIWLHTENAVVYGFIGEDRQRIRVKFITVVKDKNEANVYHVYGKSMVKNNITEFKGTLKINLVLPRNSENKDKLHYALTGDYNFAEKRELKHSGVFKGFFVSKIYTDKTGKAHYDDIDLNADGFFNNQFTGEWANYDGIQVQRCNWGDYRVPNSGSFDVGAGEFVPAEEYARFGWQNLLDASSSGQKADLARKEEEREWWK